jgi:hypothetical protein
MSIEEKPEEKPQHLPEETSGAEHFDAMTP